MTLFRTALAVLSIAVAITDSGHSVANDSASAQDRLASCDTRVALAAAREILNSPRTLNEPLEMFPAALALFMNGEKDEAIFWFYAAQLRVRYQLAFEKGDRGQLLTVMMMTMGPFINNYALQDVRRLDKALDRVSEWDQRTPNPFKDRPRSADIEDHITRVYSGIRDFRTKLHAEKDDLESKARLAAPGIEELSIQSHSGKCDPSRPDAVDRNRNVATASESVKKLVKNQETASREAGKAQAPLSDRHPTGSTNNAPKRKLADVISTTFAPLRPGAAFRDCDECPEMVVLPPGRFEMGATTYFVQPRIRTVQIGAPFALAKTEITQGQWRAIMGSNPSHFANCGDECPVERITWSEATEYVQKLSQRTGRTYRLPSEAEWEYACKAGRLDNFCGSGNIDEVAWYGAAAEPVGNSAKTTNPVGTKSSNTWNLHDMSGNVWEWTEDCWGNDLRDAPTDGTARIVTECKERVIRGGSWYDGSRQSVAVMREPFLAYLRHRNVGFRPARQLP